MKIPGLPAAAAEGQSPPSDTMLMMAAAVMHEQGRLFPKPDEMLPTAKPELESGDE